MLKVLGFFWNLQGSHFTSPKEELAEGFPGGCLLALVLRSITEMGLAGVSIEMWRGKGPSGECLARCGWEALESSAW